MNQVWLSAAIWLGMLGMVETGFAQAQPAPFERDLGGEVRRIFANKCAGCHGPELAKPKGRFGYVLDLRRVAANPEMVIPERPTESELWVLVQKDEMPPPDSPHGGLTSAQKEVIQAWVAAGAPEAISLDLDMASESTAFAPTDMATSDRVVRWLGKFHLLLIHFPIALVFAAAAAEGWSIWQRQRVPSQSVRFCLWLGALAAIPAAVLGWLYAAVGNGASSLQLLMTHRWLGTSTAAWLVITAIYAESDVQNGERSRGVRLMLALAVLSTGLTAHLGGLLDRGADFFTY